MKHALLRRALPLLSALCFALCAATAHADEAVKELSTTAKWIVKNGKRPHIVISLASALSPKQQSILSGGFTTVSQLSLMQVAPGREETPPKPFYSLRCTVKFDAWEETYDVARLDDPPVTSLEKEFKGYSNLCLSAELSDPQLVAQFAASGGQIYAELVVKQTSQEEAERIKEWLIQQQSGLMQGLFSHMLGELSLNQTVAMHVGIPPKPAQAEHAAGRKPPASKPPKSGKG